MQCQNILNESERYLDTTANGLIGYRKQVLTIHHAGWFAYLPCKQVVKLQWIVSGKSLHFNCWFCSECSLILNLNILKRSSFPISSFLNNLLNKFRHTFSIDHYVMDFVLTIQGILSGSFFLVLTKFTWCIGTLLSCGIWNLKNKQLPKIPRKALGSNCCSIVNKYM